MQQRIVPRVLTRAYVAPDVRNGWNIGQIIHYFVDCITPIATKLKSANFSFRCFSNSPPNIVSANNSSYTVVVFSILLLSFIFLLLTTEKNCNNGKLGRWKLYSGKLPSAVILKIFDYIDFCSHLC